ncbi:MAG: transposase [Patescibacteria group bacterium]
MNREQFATGEFYHIYNRGVEKRDIFSDENNRHRFLESMIEFNTLEPIGSLYERAIDIRLGKKKASQSTLVDIVCYCLNPNHYHFILRQNSDGVISEFMKRLGGGYTKYFNIKHNRSGVLFQGVFKSRHVTTNEYLLYISAYVNLNYRAHRIGRETSKSSWDEYINRANFLPICKKEIILNQFKDTREYEVFAEDALSTILEKKKLAKELEMLLLE